MTGSIPAGAPAPGTYTLDPERTTIRADVKAMFGLTTVHGTFRLQSGQVSIGADPGASSVQASIAAGSYASGHTKRHADVTSASLLDARAFPEITFSGQGARRDGDDWVVPGSVTAHGTAVPAEIRLSDVRQENGEARFWATARLDLTSFGVTKKKGMVGRPVDLPSRRSPSRPESAGLVVTATGAAPGAVRVRPAERPGSRGPHRSGRPPSPHGPG
jgi:polyisoprenoid-binding protein YceI